MVNPYNVILFGKKKKKNELLINVTTYTMLKEARKKGLYCMTPFI